MGMGMGMMGATQMPMMMPRCTMKMEKCKGGMKMTCCCQDKAQCAMMQNLCMMTGTGMCSCCMMMNGMMMMQCNMVMGACKCEMTADGMCMTCTSGDEACCMMIQACCDAMSKMMEAGCTCCMMVNGMPVCCGTC